MAEVTEEQQENIAAPAVVVKKSRAGLWIGLAALILSLLVAAAGFYFFQQIQSSQVTENNQDDLKQIEIDKSINGLHQQIADLQAQITNMNSEITGKDNHFTQTLADFSSLHEERLTNTKKDLEIAISGLQRQMSKTRGDWLLADAEYLLTVANQRLHLVGDVATTRLALEAADERLRDSGDAAVFKVREQIAKELALLNGVTVPDIVGLYGTLQHLQESVESMDVFLPHPGKQPDKSQSTSSNLADQENGLLSTVAKQLQGYVVLRHTQQPIDAILTPEEAHFTRQQLKVRLEMIEIALVQQNDALFATSIADTRQWLKKNFAENMATERFANELNKIASVQIRAQFPDVSGSLKLLKDISKLRIDVDKSISSQPVSTSTSAAAPTAAPAAPESANKPAKP